MDSIYHPITFPGVTLTSTQKLNDLLKKNHDFHIYFEGIKHNHIAHNLIAIYTLGATDDELQAVFDKHCKIQKPLLAPPTSSVSMSDPEQFRAHMGDEAYYATYLAFFDHHLQTHSVIETFQTYYGGQTDIGAQMRFQSLSGVLHGLIHVGYGLELNHPLLMAEGLALCAVEKADYDPAIAAFTSPLFNPSSTDTSSSSSSSLLDVFHQLYAIKNDLVPGSEFNYRPHLAAIGSLQKSSMIEAICSKWHVKADATDIKIKLEELLALTFHLYTTTRQESPAPPFDFFLMHTLTSGYFIPLIISHLPDLKLQAAMLKVCCRWFATEYIIVGLPKINNDWVAHPTGSSSSSSKNDFSWSEIIGHAVVDPDEHVSKVIRALIKLDLLFGKQEQHQPYLTLAQMTIQFSKLTQDDTSVRMPWLMTGIGYQK